MRLACSWVCVGFGVGAGVLHVVACSASDEATSASDSAVVYGADDRKDVFEHDNESLKTLARKSIVALMESDAIDESDPNAIRYNAATLGEAYGLCPTERFRDQPTASSCSGTLIDDDLVLTAAHCLAFEESAKQAEVDKACADMRLVFGYYYDAPGVLHRVTSNEVFRCKEVVSRGFVKPGKKKRNTLDYAVIRLSRNATAQGFRAVPFREGNRPMRLKEPLAVIGFGSGIPAKIDSGGAVTDPRHDGTGRLDYFLGTIDTFAGNSGSGVLVWRDDSRIRRFELAGILDRGTDDDYVVPWKREKSDASTSDAGACNVVKTCPKNGCKGAPPQEIGYASRAVDDLCNTVPHALPCRCRKAPSSAECQ